MGQAINIFSSDEIKWGKIANPAVHMILNQLRLVINDIIRIYGKPYEINIELGRDVGMSTKKKTEKEFEQRANQKLNDEAKKYLSDLNMFISGKNILKYKLAKEQGWKDAYNPQSCISQSGKFMGFEIEHIIPQAKGGSDTYNNLCLVSRTDNLNKGDDFTYDYIEKNKSPEELRAVLENARARLPKKAWRFEADAREKFEDEGDSEETNRYLTDTRYVAKMSQRYLRAIVDTSDSEIAQNRILAVKGVQTAKLREKWYLDGLEYDLMGIKIPRYLNNSWVNLDTGEVINSNIKPNGNWKNEKNREWLKKPRIDHRHHAMDAIIVACSNRSLIQKMANETNLKRLEYPLPLLSVESSADFRRKVIDVLKKTNVSHKPNHSKLGELHKATGKKVLCQNPNDETSLITVYSRKILQVIKSEKDLNKLLIPSSIKDEWYGEIAEDKVQQAKLVNDFNSYLDIAEQTLIEENEKAVAEGKKKIEITDGRKILKAFRLIQEQGLWKGDKFKEYENSSSLIEVKKHGIAYQSGNNHRADFYEKDGKINFEVINRFDANREYAKNEEDKFIPMWKKSGGRIIWSLQQGDLLELDTPEKLQDLVDSQRCVVVVRKFRYGRNNLGFVLVNDARNGEQKNSKFEYMLPIVMEDIGAKWLSDRNARKIELTPFGKIHKKHKVLCNGKKTTA